MMETGLGFGLGLIVSTLIMAWFLRRFIVLPIPARPSPRLIFRLVHRADRVAYVRIMRGSMAVQMRDLNRAVRRAGREIGKALLPAIARLAHEMNRILDR
jgi:hypothetical protein